MTTAQQIKKSSEILVSHGIRPSAQRVAILGHLMSDRSHPTAEKIHQALLPEMPHLSLTTVYNTLRLMADHRAIRVIEIDQRHAHFDYTTIPHAHLWCRRCGRISDISIPATPLPEACHGYDIDEIDIYYKGICPKCSALNPKDTNEPIN